MIRSALFALPATLAMTTAASASFHFMQIEQVIGGVGGNTSAQAIQIRLRSNGQNQLSFARIRSFDAAGLNPIILCDMTTTIQPNTGGTRVLIATAAFTSMTTPTAVPNYTMIPIPADRLAAGRITFEQDNGVIYWSLSYGGAGYTGSNTGNTSNDVDGNFGPAFGGPLPTTTAQALRFTGLFSALSTSNAANYALTTGPAVFNNAVGTSFTVNQPPAPCPADLNGDGEVNPDDLSDYITCYFESPPCPNADFSGDGEVNPDDLSDAINAYFAGCA